MALPSSGQLSLNDIKTELGAASTNVSLGSMSNTAGFSEPDAISDFYGYSATTSYEGLLSSQATNSSTEACEGLEVSDTVYKNGSSSTPAVSDQLYEDSSLSTNLSPSAGFGKWYKYEDVDGGNVPYAIYLLEGNSSECVIESVSACD
jgi:hypothetical protein